jgi:hypothetical protein
LGAIRSAREQAAALLVVLVDAGFSGRSLSAQQLCSLHFKLCEDSGSFPRGWLAIAREMKRMGLRKVKLWVAREDGPELVTYYEIAEPPANVVELAAVERKRA